MDKAKNLILKKLSANIWQRISEELSIRSQVKHLRPFFM